MLIESANAEGGSRAGSRLIRETTALDPETRRPCPAQVVERAGRVYLDKTLASGRVQAVLVEEDAAFYRRYSLPELCGRHRIINHFLYVTSRCNLHCPVCYEAGRDVPEPALDALVTAVSGLRRARILLCGAEPTCRDDLPELVRAITRTGNGAILMSNGVRLADRAYARSLFDAGLDHVILAMNGLSDDVYRRLNGAPLLDVKLRALDNLEALGMYVFLSATITRGVNEDQIGPLLNLERDRPCVLQVRLRSMAPIGDHLAGGQFCMSEFVRLVCREAGIDRDRWLRQQDFFEHIGRTLGVDHVRPRLCAMRADLDERLVPLASDRTWEEWERLPLRRARLVARLVRSWGPPYLVRHAMSLRRRYRYARHPGIRRVALRVWPTLDTLDLELNRRCTSLYCRDGKAEPFCQCNILENG